MYLFMEMNLAVWNYGDLAVGDVNDGSAWLAFFFLITRELHRHRVPFCCASWASERSCVCVCVCVCVRASLVYFSRVRRSPLRRRSH